MYQSQQCLGQNKSFAIGSQTVSYHCFQICDKLFDIDEQVLILTPDFTSSKTFSHCLGPTKNNDTFQPYIKREFGKKMSVIIHCRTR